MRSSSSSSSRARFPVLDRPEREVPRGGHGREEVEKVGEWSKVALPLACATSALACYCGGGPCRSCGPCRACLALSSKALAAQLGARPSPLQS
eukprot:3087725-Pyramimonas_sp.AAC.1